MSTGKILEGVLAINKPPSISSAQVLRDLQHHFNPSSLFAPWVAAESTRRARDSHNQRQRRRDKRPPQVKIGHGGTLDPLATGVLITGIGKGTKQLEQFLRCTKTYEAVVLFGAATDTYDRVGKIIGRKGYAHITRDSVERAIQEKFRGKILQRPPIYSALRVQGKRLYEYAREGKEVPVEIKEREVEVLGLEVLEWMEGGTHQYQWPTEEAEREDKVVAANVLHLDADLTTPPPETAAPSTTPKRKRAHLPETEESDQDNLVHDAPLKRLRTDTEDPEALMSGGLGSASPPAATNDGDPAGPPAARLLMTVTSGFYVRSLCQDLGVEVGSLALMSELVRTRQGQFELGKNVLEYSDLEKGEGVWGPKVEALMDDWNQAGSDEKSKSDELPESSEEVGMQEDQEEPKNGVLEGVATV